MTDPPGLTYPLPGDPNVADGLRAWLPPAWIRNCISGKKIVDSSAPRPHPYKCKSNKSPIVR